MYFHMDVCVCVCVCVYPKKKRASKRCKRREGKGNECVARKEREQAMTAPKKII